MDLQLAGKTAIVTGGGSNIGRAISLTLAREGANVVIAEIDETQGNRIVREIKDRGGNAVCIKSDVTNIDSVRDMFTAAVKLFDQIGILVNVVGGDRVGMFLDTDPDTWEWIISLNYRSNLNTFKVVLPHMVEKGFGRIVNIASDAGRIGEYREAVYSGCKAAIIAFSKSIAREVGRHKITVNCVCPGFTPPDTDQDFGTGSRWSTADRAVVEDFLKNAVKAYPLRRLTTPQDIANAVTFLASDSASFITGQTLSVSGGYSMV